MAKLYISSYLFHIDEFFTDYLEPVIEFLEMFPDIILVCIYIFVFTQWIKYILHIKGLQIAIREKMAFFVFCNVEFDILSINSSSSFLVILIRKIMIL